MDQELLDAVRHVLQQELVPELRMLAERLDQAHRKLQQSVSVLAGKIETAHGEMVATRAELVQLRKELQATRDDALGPASRNRLLH